jgi:hypothetical protein
MANLPSGGRNRPLATFASLAVMGALLAQSGWLLRPFVVRPRAEIAFVRPIESDVYSSLLSVQRSAKGDYRGWDARRGGLLAAPETPVEPALAPPLETQQGAR